MPETLDAARTIDVQQLVLGFLPELVTVSGTTDAQRQRPVVNIAAQVMFPMQQASKCEGVYWVTRAYRLSTY
jgi:hypothetical protein